MNMTLVDVPPRTTTEMVFNRLYEEILTLKLLPGTRISEADIANRLGVSRQPVRDAFNRLGNLGLLMIRPQRATEVRGFSMVEIENARFIRLSVELEVVECGCAVWTDASASALEETLEVQRSAIDAGETEKFHALDYDFHRQICDLAGHPLAFDTIEQSKRLIDRLCMLGLDEGDEGASILADHEELAQVLAAGSAKSARAIMRHHLGRLDATIARIHQAHSDYFE